MSSCPDLNNNRNAEQGNVVMMGVKRSDDDNDHSNSPKKRKIEDAVPFCEDDVALTSSINEIKPLETGRQFTKTDMQNDVQFDKEVYQQAIGCLTYL